MSDQSSSTSPSPQPDDVPDERDERDFNALWNNALVSYEDETKENLREHPVMKDFPSGPRTATQVIKHFEKQKGLFKVFRTGGEKVRGVLTSIVDVLLALKEGAGGASVRIIAFVTIRATRTNRCAGCDTWRWHFTRSNWGAAAGEDAPAYHVSQPANDVQATKGVRELYDAVEDLLEEVLAGLERFKIHFEEPPTPRAAIKNIIVEALVQVLMVLALATKYCNLKVSGVRWYKRVLRVFWRRTSGFYALPVVICYLLRK